MAQDPGADHRHPPAPVGLGHRAVVLYDADCGFCRWSLAWILRWDRHELLRPVALQDPEADRLLPDLDEEAKMASWHLVAPQGARHSAGQALPPLLRLLPGGRPLAGISAALPGTTERGYRWVADHRGLLGRLVGDRARRRADDVIAGRRSPAAPRSARITRR